MLEEVVVQCPTCWESQELSIDTSAGDQDYTEDCTVCCRPMAVRVRLEGGAPEVAVEAE
ncbi:MAG: CPXCG motif-containing cysteine-rich protein [Pseudomonadota bacterium]